MTKTYYTIIASCFCSLFFAQQNTFNIEGAKVDYMSSITNLPLQVSFDETKHLSEIQFTDWIKKELIKNDDVSFTISKTNTDALGFKHNRYQQYYKGYNIQADTMFAALFKAG